MVTNVDNQVREIRQSDIYARNDTPETFFGFHFYMFQTILNTFW